MNVRALVFCGDAWHPAELIQRGLQPLAEAGVRFEFVRGVETRADQLLEFPVVILAKGNHVSEDDQQPWIQAANQSLFRDFVRSGGGLFVIHGGACYRDWPEVRGVTGGAFLHHPEQCPVTFEPKPQHSMTRGGEAFSQVDEHYHMVLDDAGADVFLRSQSRYGQQPAGWTRREGGGRVCVLTPGHNSEVWHHTAFQTLLRNGLSWLAKLT